MNRREVIVTGAAASFLATTTAALAKQTNPRLISQDVEVKGHYRWVLYQVVDNPTDSVSELSVRVRKTQKLSVVDFVKSVASEKRVYAFSGKVTFGVKAKEFEVGGEASYSTHREVFSSLERASTTTTTDETVTEIVQTFTLPAKYSGEIYRLEYEMGGVLVKTDILSLTRRDDLTITATIDIENRLPGFAMLVNKLSAIVPKSDNRGEWRAIRSSIIQNTSKPNPEQFEALLKTFSSITPKRDNRGEWSMIREECNSILSALPSGNYYPFFIRFVRLLSGIKPKADNKGEWAAIRGVSGEILKGIQEL